MLTLVSEYSHLYLKCNFMELSERQQEIIKAALELISEMGIQGLTIKNLSKKIGVVESAIYRHFENKTQIILALLNYIKSDNNEQGKDTQTSIWTKFEMRLKNHFKTFSEFPALVSVVFAEDLFQNEAILQEKTKEFVQDGMLKTKTLIEKGQKNGEFRSDIDAEHLAFVLNGTIRMFVKHWKMSGYEYNLIEKGTELINSIKQILKNNQL